ncbi:unnamed protein product [Rhizophagus irregularis]|nr:unnamed protein product [Rhizophagus irregularis]
MKPQRFVCGLLKIGKRRTKVRLAFEDRKNQDLFGRLGFGGLLKNEKELRFISLVGHVDQRLGIEINSFALSGSNCFSFLIPNDRID